MLIALNATIDRLLPKHQHAVHELIVCRNSCGTLVTDEQTVALEKGLSLLIRGGQLHEIKATCGAADVIMICFDNHFLSEHTPVALRPFLISLLQEQGLSINPVVEEKNIVLAEQIQQTLTSVSPLSQLHAGIKLSELLLHHVESRLQNLPLTTPHFAPIKNAIKWLESNLEAKITIADMAQRTRLSKTAFTQRFRQMTGMSLIEYTNKLRLEKALQYLAIPEQTITDIAYQCGFNNLGYFYKSFNEHFNMTPNQYRKTLRIQGLHPPAPRT